MATVYDGASLRNILIMGGTYLLVMFLGIVGIARSLIDHRERSSLLLLYLAYLTATHLAVTGMIRFRLPLEPIIIICAAAGAFAVYSLVGRLKAVGHLCI